MELHDFEIIITVLTVCIVLMLTIPAASALGIAPALIEDVFEPGMEKTFNIKIINSEHQTTQVALQSDGELGDYITFEPKEFTIKGTDAFKKVKVALKLPDDIGEPGSHETRILVSAAPLSGSEGNTQISVNVVVYSLLRIFVPYPGKYANIKLIAPNFRVGTESSFGIEINNLGTESFFADSMITVKSPLEATIASLKGKKTAVEPKKSELVSIPWTPENSGKFRAISDVVYGERKYARDEKEFSIGEPVVDIFTITSDNFRRNGISRFDIIVENKWNEMLDDVYADVVIMTLSGDQITKYTSTHVSIPPLSTQSIPAYLETTELKDEKYAMAVTLHYLGKDDKKTFDIKVAGDSVSIEGTGKVIAEKPEKSETENIYELLYLVIIVIIISNIFLYKKLTSSRRGSYITSG